MKRIITDQQSKLQVLRERFIPNQSCKDIKDAKLNYSVRGFHCVQFSYIQADSSHEPFKRTNNVWKTNQVDFTTVKEANDFISAVEGHQARQANEELAELLNDKLYGPSAVLIDFDGRSIEWIETAIEKLTEDVFAFLEHCERGSDIASAITVGAKDEARVRKLLGLEPDFRAILKRVQTCVLKAAEDGAGDESGIDIFMNVELQEIIENLSL